MEKRAGPNIRVAGGRAESFSNLLGREAVPHASARRMPDEVRLMWATAPPRMPLMPEANALEQDEDEAE